MGALGHAFGLLRLPGMSETKKGRGVDGFVPSPVDPESGALRLRLPPSGEEPAPAILKSRRVPSLPNNTPASSLPISCDSFVHSLP